MNTELLSRAISTREIPPGGKHVSIEADASERRRLADAIGIPEILSLVVELDVQPVGGRVFNVKGTLSASVVQTDVVTLEPVEQQVAEEIDVTLRPAENAPTKGREAVALADAATEVDEGDLYRKGKIQLGLIISEHLALGLDPYPRAPGVVFPGHLEDDATADASPFAQLASLKRPEE